MQRYADWPVRLRAAIKAAEGQPFHYGRHDCCTAAAGVILAVTGTDLMKGWRGRYRSAAGAARVMGGASLLETVAPVFGAAGAAPIPPAMATAGDLVLTDKAQHDACRGQALGICIGAGALFPGEAGWISLPVSACIAAWRV
ncbi:DUF6950 family protein [Gimibacter soli]|uniref:DUF6950 domain-containing protein n=1 Tax=Gimibacter soli TaxID=3024400 RepID=A0AAF0BI85_9PROT|nr:hypothetical protein [Gimibacter soli]WCL55093.1 hypothetical protein PH603_04895 [Gimibacter soli]